MKISRITASLAADLPSCDAQVSGQTAYWRARVQRDNRCDLKAHYLIDGKRFCDRHAGKIVIAYVIEREGGEI